MSCNVVVGDGIMGVCVWLGAPIMHSMSGLSLARHWHGYLSIQFGIVWLGGLLLISPALASVNKQVFMLAWSVCVIRWTALLCLEILRPFRWGCSHNERRCGHVSLSLLWHSVQLGFWCVCGQKIFFLWLPMYCAYLNFKVWVIWASVILSSFQKWLESFWFIWSFDNHLSTYGNLVLVVVASQVSCSFIIDVHRFQMAPLCVAVGQLDNQ